MPPSDNDDFSSNDDEQVSGACAVAECGGTGGGASSTTGEVAVFTLDEDSPSNNEAAPEYCGNVSSEHPAVSAGEWCVTPHGAMTSVRKVEEWIAKTSLEGNVESPPIAATTSRTTVDNLPESAALLRVNVCHESTPEHCGTEEGCVGSAQMAQSASAAALSTAAKVRPDTSWIKEALPVVPSDGATIDEDETNSAVENEPVVSVDIDVPAVDVTDPKPCVTASDDCDSSVDSDGVAERKEIGVVAHYEKELIPWNTGTVRRQTQDLEHRLKSGLKLQSDASSPVSSAESPVSVHDDLIGATTPNPPSPDVADNRRDDSPLMSPERSTSSNDLQTKRPVSTIYANEDISLEPGIVMRTKCEIEERTK